MSSSCFKIQTTALELGNYLPYGSIVGSEADILPLKVNQGTGLKYSYQTHLENLRGTSAKPEISIYQCVPSAFSQAKLFKVNLLERHLFSSQLFMPLDPSIRYLVIVALNQLNHQPDIKTLKAFVATGRQGISYHPGTWHHPIVALDQEARFMCLVWEDGSSNDCEIHPLSESIDVCF